MITATAIYCLNELGKRFNNEDAVAPMKGKATLQDKVFVVCDGVGGEKKGEVASAIAASAVHQYLMQPLAGSDEKDAIQKAIHHASKQLVEYALTDDSAKRMSTTLAVVYLGTKGLHIAWCGDTRVHHIRNGKILWKSQDHSLVGELVSQGELTEEEARSHPKRNIITRSLNALNYNNTADFHQIRDVETGDYLLLCTDGFLERVDEQIISKVLKEDKQSNKGEEFLRFCEGLTRDNFSMYLIQIANNTNQETARTNGGAVWILLLIIACTLLLWYLL